MYGKLLYAVLCVAAVTLAGCATPQPKTSASPPASAAAAPAKAQTDPNKVICHTELPTGSRLGGRKICMTAQEEEQLREDNKRKVQDYERQLPPTPSAASGG